MEVAVTSTWHVILPLVSEKPLLQRASNNNNNKKPPPAEEILK